MNRLYNEPKEPPVELLGNYPKGKQARKAPPVGTNTQVLIGALKVEDAIPTSTVGIVPNGLSDARGFITAETSAQAAQRQKINEDALDVWSRSRAEAEEIARQRRALLSQPNTTADPDHWRTVSQREHVPLLDAVEPIGANSTLQFRDAQKRGRGTMRVENPLMEAARQGLAGSLSRSSPDARHGYGNKFAATAEGRGVVDIAARDAAIKDVDVLRAQLADEQQSGVVFSRNGTTGRVDTQPLPPKRQTGQFINLQTSNAGYGNFDRSFYTDPHLFPEVAFTPDEVNVIQGRREAEERKCAGGWSTTHSEHFQDRTAESEVPAEYRKAHFFDRKNASMQMRRGNDPTLKATNRQNTQNPADVVPENYETTSMAFNKHFRQYL